MSDSLTLIVEKIQDLPSTAFLKVEGPIDATTVVKFQEKLESLQKEGQYRFIVDMSQVTYVNSTGVSTLVSVSDSLSTVDGGIVLVNPHPKAQVVFKMLGLDAFFEIFDTLVEAKGHFEAMGVSEVIQSIDLGEDDSDQESELSSGSNYSSDEVVNETINLSDSDLSFSESNLDTIPDLDDSDDEIVELEQQETKCIHCSAGFGTTKFDDGTRLRCDCGFMNVIKYDHSKPTPYEILGVKTNDSLAACRNAWNRIQSKYPFNTNAVANWQARQAFYKIKANAIKKPFLFEVPGEDGCLACEPLRKIELFCCVVCGKQLQPDMTKEQRDKLRKQLRSKLVELSDWDELLEELQDYVRAEELILRDELKEAEEILVKLRDDLSEKTTATGNQFEMLQYVTLALFKSRRSTSQFNAKDEEALHRLLMVDPDQQKILLLAAILALSEFEFVEANHYFDHLVNLGNQDGVRLSSLTYFLSRDYEKALAPIQTEQTEIAKFFRARIYVASGHFEKSEKLYSDLLKEKEDPVVLYHYACFLATSGKQEKALEVFQKCETLLPNDPRPTLMAANVLTLLKKYEEAEKKYQECAARGSEVDSLLGQAKLAYYREELNKSIEFVQKALEKEPEHFEAQLSMGNLLEKQGELEKALTHYSNAIAKNPDPKGWGLVNMGLLNLKMGEKEKSRRYLAEAFKGGSQSAGCLAALGMSYIELRDYVSAKMVWEKLYKNTLSVEVKKNLANITYLLAKFEIRKGQYYKAIKNLQQCMKYSGSKQGLETILSEVFFRLGTQEMFYQFQDGGRPRKFFNFANQFQPNNAYIQYYLGHVLLQMGEFKKALSCFQKAYEIKPKPQFIRQVCLTRILLEDETAKDLLLELPVDPGNPGHVLATVWFEVCYYISMKKWKKSLDLLHFVLNNADQYQLTVKEKLKLRILLIRILQQIDESNHTETIAQQLDKLFGGDTADLMQGIYLLLNQDFDEAKDILGSLYERTEDDDVLEAYRYLFAILITKSKLNNEDAEEVLTLAKTELVSDPEVFNWELSEDIEEEDLPTYSILLNTFSEEVPQMKSSMLSSLGFREDPDTKPLEPPYPGLLSKEGFILLKQEKLRIGTEAGCDLIIKDQKNESFVYELNYYKEAGKFVLSAPKETPEFFVNDLSRRRAYLNHRDRISFLGRKFTFLEERDPTLVYGDVAYGMKMADDWRLMVTDLRNITPEEDFATLQFSNVSISRLSSMPKEDYASLELNFE